MLAVMALVAVAGLFGLFVIMKGGAKGKATGGYLQTIESAAGSFIPHSVGVASHGALFDQVEAMGLKLVAGGYVDETAWQAFFGQIATAMTKKKPLVLQPQSGVVVEQSAA
jgi:hypothetical protein